MLLCIQRPVKSNSLNRVVIAGTYITYIFENNFLKKDCYEVNDYDCNRWV